MDTGNTIWKHGRFDSKRGNKQLLFGRMYEDAAIELKSFVPRGRIICIASAGCTAISLSPHHNEIIAVDINPVQTAYVEKRLQGSNGYKGKAEKIMDRLRFFGPLVGWWPSDLKKFTELDSTADQIDFWNKKLKTRRIRTAMTLLLSKRLLGTFYSRELLDAIPDNLGKVILKRMELCFLQHSNKTNPYLKPLLLGEFSGEQTRLLGNNIKLVTADVLHHLQNSPSAFFNGFSLSNILDGANPEYQEQLFKEIKRTALPGAMTVLRSFKNTNPSSVKNMAAEDRSMLWGSVFVLPADQL